MKKKISWMLSIIMALSTLSISFPAIAQEIEKNNAILVTAQVSELCEKYDDEYQERLEDPSIGATTINDRIIVKTKSKINTYDSVDEVYGLGYAFVQFDSNESAEDALEQYESQGYIAEYDTVYKMQEVSSSSTITSEWAYERIEADSTLSYFENKKLDDVIVGVMDSGIDYTHSLLKDRVIRTNVNFSNSGLENDEMDDEGHGTSVSGIIAKCTPDNVKIENFKIGDNKGNIYQSAVICCIEYILSMSQKPDVINMSFASSYTSNNSIQKDAYNSLIDNGIVIVAAAGNNNNYADDRLPSGVENAITVSASDQNNAKCSFSNFGEIVDIAAPGTGIYTSELGGGYIENFSGTSGATPLVSAGAAIVLMQNKNLSPAEVCEKLKSAAVPIQKVNDVTWAGAGLLNLRGLIESERLSPVNFSYSDDDYKDSISVELSCPDKSVKIIYTTDLSLPSLTNGITYSNPIEVTEQTKIIAAAFPLTSSDNKLHSNYTSANYQIIRNADESDFEIDDDGTITAYNGEYKSIIVPDEIKGIIPTSIGIECFMGRDIQHIELPDSVTYIKRQAFKESSLQSIIGAGITQIGVEAFMDCFNFYKEYMPNVKIVNQKSFYWCTLITDFSFKESATNLHSYCFAGSGLQEADFPNVVRENRSFEHTPIVSASLPKITDLVGGFQGCDNLEEVYLPNITSISEQAFYGCELLTEPMDFTNITEVGYGGFQYSFFPSIDLPNCISVESYAFDAAYAKTINIPLVKEINVQTFGGYYIEEIYMDNVEEFYNSELSHTFINCGNLKYLYLPNAKNIPTFGWDAKNAGYCNIEFIYAPQATEFSRFNSNDMSICTNLKFIYAPKLTSFQKSSLQLPDTDLTLYFSNDFTSTNRVKLSNKYTIVAPSDSYAESVANEFGCKFLSSDSYAENTESSNVSTNGRSICTTVAGLRFGFYWNNIDEIESLASDIEYGFVYSQKGVEDLSLDKVDGVNVKSVTATNRIDHGDTTSFNLVISNIPKSYYDREITARAYVCIDGMYFYSNEQKGSFGEVANLVLADNEIDTNTKNAVKNLLEKEA